MGCGEAKDSKGATLIEMSIEQRLVIVFGEWKLAGQGEVKRCSKGVDVRTNVRRGARESLPAACMPGVPRHQPVPVSVASSLTVAFGDAEVEQLRDVRFAAELRKRTRCRA